MKKQDYSKTVQNKSIKIAEIDRCKTKKIKIKRTDIIRRETFLQEYDI